MWHTAKYGDPYSEFVLCINPSNVPTHISEHTHSVNTHPEQWAAIYVAVPGEQLGFGALLKGTSVVVLRVKSSWTFTPLTYNCRTRNLSIMSPTLKPLDHDM